MLLFDAVKEKVKSLDVDPEKIDILDVCEFFKDYISKKYNSEISFGELSKNDYAIIENLNIVTYENKIEFIKNHYNYTSENHSLNMILFETINGFINSHLNDNCSLISRHDKSIEMVFEIIEE